jgi:hypothetical protein
VRLALAAAAAVSAALGGAGCAAPAHPAQHAAHHASPRPAQVTTSSAAALPARPSRSEANYVPPPQLLLHRVQFGAVQPGTRFTITSAHQDLAIVPLAGFHRIYVPVNSAAVTSVARAH